jgi:CIC family chloride channel protein
MSAMLVVLKLVATTTSYSSGNAGGIFGPSLFIGAMFGGTLGSIAHRLLPAHTATAGAYALVGMGTAFAGIVRAPMTSVVMIFETTQDYAIIVPLMISNLVSFFISSRLQREPIYEALARQDGIHLPGAETHGRHRQRQVADAMRAGTDVMQSQITLREAFERAHKSDFQAWPVIDEGGVVGVVSLARIEEAMANGEGAKKLSDIVPAGNFPHVHPDQPLHLALERMGAAKLEILPVVSRANIRDLLGVVVMHDVLNLFGIEHRDRRESTH